MWFSVFTYILYIKLRWTHAENFMQLSPIVSKIWAFEKDNIVKFERDVNTPGKENDVTIIIFKFKWRSENIKAKKFISNTLTVSFNLSCVRISKNKTYLLLLRTLNSPLKVATLPFSN